MTKPQLRVSLRVDGSLREGLEGFMRESGTNLAQSMRMLLSLGLDRSSNLPQTFKRSAVREGLNLGLIIFYERMQRMLAEMKAEADDQG